MSILLTTLHADTVPLALPQRLTPELRGVCLQSLLQRAAEFGGVDPAWVVQHERGCASGTEQDGMQAYCDRVIDTLAALRDDGDGQNEPQQHPGAAVTPAVSRNDAVLQGLRRMQAAVDAVKAGMGGKAQDVCPKCRSERTTTRSVQTRSADEGATMVCSCDACGHAWRYNT